MKRDEHPAVSLRLDGDFRRVCRPRLPPSEDLIGFARAVRVGNLVVVNRKLEPTPRHGFLAPTAHARNAERRYW